MTKNKIDILLLFETKVNQNLKEIHDDYTFIFSSEVSQEQKDLAEKRQKKELIQERKTKPRGKKTNNRMHYA